MNGGIARFSARVAALVLAAWLTGCASLPGDGRAPLPPRDTLAEFELDGRFSLTNETKSFSGRLNWVHRRTSSEVLLASPFGQAFAEISSTPQQARLKTGDGKAYAADDVESLTQQVLGYPLPLSRLADWVRGSAAAGGELDPQGRLLSLRDDGWRIEYGYAGADPQSPPVRIVARRGEAFELRLFVESWHSLAAEPGR